jgi:AcrR family transcriptional regulator
VSRDGVGHLTLRQLNEQLRSVRTRELLATASRIIAAQGLGALTMQRVATDDGCSIGSLYRYFPSKDALLVELQREAVRRLGTSFALSQAHLDHALERHALERHPFADARFAALARVVAATRFWISAETVFPQEVELSRRASTGPTVGRQVLEVATQLLDGAVAAGALDPAPSVDRAAIVLAGTTGILMTSGLGRPTVEAFDGHRLATRMARDLFVSWGATPGDLDAADDLVAALAEHDRLVPPIEPGSPSG